MIDWGFTKEFITNEDSNFLGKFWIVLFAKLGVKLLYSIAYHPQTVGASEQVNQTIEIAMQFFVHIIKDPS